MIQVGGIVLQAHPATLSKATEELCGLDFETSTVPMWVFDQETLAFLAVNDAAVRIYGYARSQFLRMSILDIRPPEEVIAVVRDALHPHESHGTAERWRHRDQRGEVFEVEIQCHDLMYEAQPARLVISRKLKTDRE